MAAFEPLGNGMYMYSAPCIQYRGGVGYRWEIKSSKSSGGEHGRNQIFTAMFRTLQCIKQYHSVIFMLYFRREKGSSLTGMYFLIKVHLINM